MKRPREANNGQQRPTQAKEDQRRPMQASEGQRRPTTADKGPRRSTTADKGPRMPTKESGPQQPTMAKEVTGFWSGIFIYVHYLSKLIYKKTGWDQSQLVPTGPNRNMVETDQNRLFGGCEPMRTGS